MYIIIIIQFNVIIYFLNKTFHDTTVSSLSKKPVTLAMQLKMFKILFKIASQKLEQVRNKSYDLQYPYGGNCKTLSED